MHFRYRGLLMSGNQGPLIVTEFTPPVASRRASMVDRLNDHGVVTAPEWLDAATWGITVATNTDSLESAMELAGEVESRWTNRSDMASSATTPLEYSLDGVTWYRVYGRPGRFTGIGQGQDARTGTGYMELEFVQTDMRHYSGQQYTSEVSAAPAIIGALLSPLVAPLTTMSTGATRAGRMTNQGDLPAPVTVTFRGPCTDPKLTTSAGLEFGYRGTLAYDQYVVINPIDQTVLLNGRTSVPGRLTFKTRIGRMAIPSGTSDWFFAATDQTGTSKAVMTWRDAYSAMQH